MTTGLLFAFSDGIIEAPNAANEEFGETRLIEVVRDACNTSPENIRDVVLFGISSKTRRSPTTGRW